MSKKFDKREQVLSRKFFGELEVLGNSSFRTDYVECLCSCGQVCDINFYNILDGKRTCCIWCNSPKTVEARNIGKFHHLTVIGHGKSAGDLKCKCACGVVRDTPSLRLLNGDNKTCGCGYGKYTKADECLDRKTFGRLTVVSKSDKSGRVDCICSCGNVTKSCATSLLGGTVSSCGCLRNESSSLRMRERGTMKVGQQYLTNCGDKMVVVDYIDCDNVYVQFLDEHVVKASAGSIRKGEVKNPYKRIVSGVGFFGVGGYKSKDKAYSHWSHMLRRCYSDDYGHTYDNSAVEEIWHDYQNFAKWFYQNWQGNNDVALDKDILVKGNKIYSPQTCTLVPENLNNFTCKAGAIRGDLPIGVRKREHERYTKYQAIMYRYNKLCHLGKYSSVLSAFKKYKHEKEKHAKVLADSYFEQGLISLKTKDALYNYTVDITD